MHCTHINYLRSHMKTCPSIIQRTHKVSLNTVVLYDKFLTGHGRGGYYMENSIFFNHILAGLGFRVYTASA